MSLSLLEMSEKLIQIFKPKRINKEKAYLVCFQDVLLDFGKKKVEFPILWNVVGAK